MQNFISRLLKKNNTPAISKYIHPSDTFIVSYPKSGSTWVRFVLSNLIVQNEIEITFKAADKYIPEWNVHHEFLEKLSHPRLIKSHSMYDSKFRKIIYLVRDPRDVYVSYFFYLKKRLPENYSIHKFIKKGPVPNWWFEHVKSWINHPNLIVVRYEDLLKNPISEFHKIINFIPEYNFNEGLLEMAIAKSSFDKMTQVEKKYGRNFLSSESKKVASQFMRKGIEGDWQNYLSNEDIKIIQYRESSIMQLLNYNLTS